MDNTIQFKKYKKTGYTQEILFTEPDRFLKMRLVIPENYSGRVPLIFVLVVITAKYTKNIHV